MKFFTLLICFGFISAIVGDVTETSSETSTSDTTNSTNTSPADDEVTPAPSNTGSSNPAPSINAAIKTALQKQKAQLLRQQASLLRRKNAAQAKRDKFQRNRERSQRQRVAKLKRQLNRLKKQQANGIRPNRRPNRRG